MPPKSLICGVGSNRFHVEKEWIQVNLTVPLLPHPRLHLQALPCLFRARGSRAHGRTADAAERHQHRDGRADLPTELGEPPGPAQCGPVGCEFPFNAPLLPIRISHAAGRHCCYPRFSGGYHLLPPPPGPLVPRHPLAGPGHTMSSNSTGRLAKPSRIASAAPSSPTNTKLLTVRKIVTYFSSIAGLYGA